MILRSRGRLSKVKAQLFCQVTMVGDGIGSDPTRLRNHYRVSQTSF